MGALSVTLVPDSAFDSLFLVKKMPPIESARKNLETVVPRFLISLLLVVVLGNRWNSSMRMFGGDTTKSPENVYGGSSFGLRRPQRKLSNHKQFSVVTKIV
jgi:hypothetical protein